MSIKRILGTVICTTAALSVSAQAKTDVNVPKKLGDKVVALAPVQLSENGVAGFGVSYEQALDKEGIIAFYLPGSIVINTNSESRLGNNAHYNDPMFYLMPGIKLYPTGNQGLTKYAIGPALVFATGQRTEADSYPYYSSYVGYTTHQHSIFGMMVNQSVNVSPSPHLYIGAEFGFGYSYINRLDGINQATTGLVQFSFKIGYRY
jgi:hypothetical protein